MRLSLFSNSVCLHVEPPPPRPMRETFKDRESGINIAIWTGPKSQMPYRDSWLHTPS